MRKKVEIYVEIPEGIKVEINGQEVSVKGPAGELKRKFESGIKIEIKENKVYATHPNGTKREKKMAHTIAAHISNMMKGAKEKFEYRLRVCAAHFPITANIEGKKLRIKNFLGESKDREARILENVEVKVEKDLITVSSNNLEAAGQTAANFESATKVKARDRRVFQDGIFIIEKPGRVVE